MHKASNHNFTSERFHYCKPLSATLLALAISIASTGVYAETVIVEMKKFKFVPDEITIKAGDTVRWLNTERRLYHTIWFKEVGDKETAALFSEEFFEKTFDTPGNTPIYVACTGSSVT